jgi:[protein-PII] uridylyltransferase
MAVEIRREHLTAAAAGGVHGREYSRRLADITDEWVIDLFDAAVAEHPTAAAVSLVAVGGYGRGELAPFSDLDLLLVHDAKPRRVSSEIEPIARAIWYPIWDCGVKLGHAVRRVGEQLDLIDDDLDSATSSLTARPLAGDDQLAAEVIGRCRSAWRANGADHLDALRTRMLERQASSADVAYRLEPDLKAGHGGLRDVQTVWWAIEGGLTVPGRDRIELDDCYDVLVRSRVALHLATQRAGDVLRLEDQDAAATAGGWSDADELMAAVAAAGRSVAFLNEECWDRTIDRSAEPERAVAPGVVLHRGEIELTERADVSVDPALALRAAVAAARSERRIGRDTLERLRDDLEPWSSSWPVGATDELVALLLEGRRAIPVLEALDQHELFTRFLPEWEPVRSKPQRNAYHQFTVDRHLWEAAANAASLTDRVGRPDLLVLGGLFHDIGKGYPGDHTDVGMELVRTIAPRLGFGHSDIDMLVALVEHHLLLPDVAVRRDLTDDATIEFVASAVGSVEALELLHALTEADSKATGPSAWGSWKKGLVDELVARVRHVLGDGVAPEFAWRLFPDEETVRLMAGGEISIRRQDDTITVVCPDTAGSFSQIAGVLSLHGLDVLTAQALSDEQGMAASRFRVEVPNEAEMSWTALDADLRRGLDHELAIEARLAERARTYRRRRRTQALPPSDPTVTHLDGASSNASVIEVRAVTTIGILHRITKALSELGLDIRHATVQTMGMEVVDTFYVRTRDGRLVDDERHREEITRALLHVVA